MRGGEVENNISGPILIPWTPRKVVTMVEEARAAGAGVVVGGRPSDVGELHFQLVSLHPGNGHLKLDF